MDCTKFVFDQFFHKLKWPLVRNHAAVLLPSFFKYTNSYLVFEQMTSSSQLKIANIYPLPYRFTSYDKNLRDFWDRPFSTDKIHLL